MLGLGDLGKSSDSMLHDTVKPGLALYSWDVTAVSWLGAPCGVLELQQKPLHTFVVEAWCLCL